MLKVYGHIKDNRHGVIHKKIIPNIDYVYGIDFNVLLDYESISDDVMPAAESTMIVLNAINNKYGTDFSARTSFINPLDISKISTSVKELTTQVNDDTFEYQLSEGHAIFEDQYYLGASSVYGVALERLCILICRKNNIDLNRTELGPVAHKLYEKGAIDNATLNRIIGCSKFRNTASHTNDVIYKSDAEAIFGTIVAIVAQYFTNRKE